MTTDEIKPRHPVKRQRRGLVLTNQTLGRLYR